MAVELRKGQKVSLEKRGASIGEILINLNWSQPIKKGFFSRTPQPIDLDLGCLYEFKKWRKRRCSGIGKWLW